MQAAVAVVGAGPAGCAAALTLRRYLPELTVVMIAPLPIDGPSAGETLSPGVLPLLNYLGIQERFLEMGQLPAFGTASAWGSERVFERSYLLSGRGAGWHLDRTRFDAWLLAQTKAAGAEHIYGRALLKNAILSDGLWRIEIEGGQTAFAGSIIDASGRSAQLARQRGSTPRRDDALVASICWYRHYEAERSAEGALVESVPDGWWYSATLPGQRAVAMFMTDSDLLCQGGWEDRLVQAPATRGRLKAWQSTGKTAVRAAHSQLTPTVAAEGWVAAGDAAAAFDPISSLGIGFALRSGMEAARVATAEREDAPAAAYRASIANIYADYRTRLRGIYKSERRWPQLPFWARRHE